MLKEKMLPKSDVADWPMQAAGRQLVEDTAASPLAQLAQSLNHSPSTTQLQETGQRMQPRTAAPGLPPQLQAGIETLSGVPMGHVRVHRNSSKPAQLNALAYAQGRDIHLGPGQESHLPHEAWHVVQQAQGRVQPTRQLKNGAKINDDRGLEREADVMGAKAANYALPDEFQQLGMSAQLMTASQFEGWQENIQLKAGSYGHCQVGDSVIVTQFRDPEAVTQLLLDLTWRGLKVSAMFAEGALTLGASIAALVLTGGVGTAPAIMGIIAGALKICRGIILLTSRDQDGLTDPSGVRLVLIDTARFLEGALAAVGAGLISNPALMVFGIAKAIRAILTAIADGLDSEERATAIVVLGALTSALHAIEAAALVTAGGLAVWNGVGLEGSVVEDAGDLATSSFIGAAGSAIVGLSKGVRTYREASTTHGKRKALRNPETRPLLVEG